MSIDNASKTLEHAAVLFDFDGVIIDSETTSFVAWSSIFKDEGALLTLTDWLPFVGKAAGRSPVDLLEQLSGRTQPHAQIAKDSLHRIMTERLPCRQGVRKAIRALFKCGIQLYIVSNARLCDIQRHLERLDLISYFEGIVSQDEFAGPTSKQDLYARTCTSYGLLRGPVLAVEDSEHGVLSALSCGIKVLWYPNQITAHQKCDHLCATLTYPSTLTSSLLLNLLHS